MAAVDFFRKIVSDILFFTNNQVNAGIPNTTENSLAQNIGTMNDAFQAGFYNQLKQVNPVLATDPQAIINNALGEGLSQKQPTPSSGYVTFSGTVGSIIPSGSILQNSTSDTYATQTDTTIQTQILNIASIIRSLNIVTVVTASPHNLASGSYVTISGCSPSDLNISNISIIVVDAVTFNFNSIGTSETGTGGQVTSVVGSAQVISIDTGSSTNQASSSILILTTPLTGVNNNVLVQYEGLQGGTDLESISSLQTRTIFKIQNPGTYWSANNLTSMLLQNSVATRVWVYIPANINEAGYTQTVSVNDNASPITLTSLELAEQTAYLTSICPVMQYPGYINCMTANLIPINITITSLSPNTTSMKTAIFNNLTYFFETNSVIKRVLPSNVLTDNTILVAILNTTDSTGSHPTLFSITVTGLSSITADNDLGVLGTITYV